MIDEGYGSPIPRYWEGRWRDEAKENDQLCKRIEALEAALLKAAGLFNLMGGIGGRINGVDPRAGYRECVAAVKQSRAAALAEEQDK